MTGNLSGTRTAVKMVFQLLQAGICAAGSGWLARNAAKCASETSVESMQNVSPVGKVTRTIDGPLPDGHAAGFASASTPPSTPTALQVGLAGSQ